MPLISELTSVISLDGVRNCQICAIWIMMVNMVISNIANGDTSHVDVTK